MRLKDCFFSKLVTYLHGLRLFPTSGFSYMLYALSPLLYALFARNSQQTRNT